MKDYLTAARQYTKRNLYRTKEYKRFKDNDYYHVTKYTQYLFKKYYGKQR